VLFEGATNDIKVLNCNFTNLSGQEGGGLAVNKANNLTLENCTFSLNSAINGGAIKIGAIHTALLTNNIFMNNQANLPECRAFDLIADSENLRGGAMFIDC